MKLPNKDDEMKLKYVMKYPHGTCHLKLKLLADDLSVIRWFRDASFDMHDDCKGHTGAVMTL